MRLLIDWLMNPDMMVTLLSFVQLGCIAIWKPKGVQIAKKYLVNCYDNNRDGAGFAVAAGGKLKVVKGFFQFNEFWKAFKDLQKYAALIHFRIATHGAINAENCHPFSFCDDKYAMIHNGILPIEPPKGRNESDSAHFANTILTPALPDIKYNAQWFTDIVEEAIGGGNKVVVLRQDGKPWLFNENQGYWHKGAWYSNSGYRYAWRGVSNYAGKSWTGCQSDFMRGAEERTEEEEKYGPGYHDIWERLTDGAPNESAKKTIVTPGGREARMQYDYRTNTWNEVFEKVAEEDETIGDEFVPMTEQERHVQQWLADQARKSGNVVNAKVLSETAKAPAQSCGLALPNPQLTPITC